MCGRYALYGPTSRLREQFSANIEDLPLDWSPRYNAAPMQMLPVIRQRPTGDRVAHLLRWGLIPSWSKHESIATKLINARGESLAEKPSFRAAYRARRCIVPASGFYEWRQLAGGKLPYFVTPANDDLFGFAGLWERWGKPDGGVLHTFTIVTTDANDAIRPLHARMPVILRRDAYELWLNKATEANLLRELIAPCPDAMVRMYPVAKAVGNVSNEGPALIEPLSAQSSQA